MTPDAEWLSDPKWINAAKLIYHFSDRCKFVFTIEPLCRLRKNCLPLAFGHLFSVGDQDSYAVVAPKDDIDKLPLAWIKDLEKLHVHFADDVFFAATNLQMSSTISTAYDIRGEMEYGYSRRSKILNGIRVRRDRLLDDATLPHDTPYCLIINAALTDNAGDVLLAQSAIRLITEAAPHLHCIVADPEIDRVTVANASLIVIGPGGILYDLDDHDRLAVNHSNIAAYFRFAFMAYEYGVPFGLLGIGSPAPILSSYSRHFLREALRHAKFFHLRDPRSLATVSDAFSVKAPTIVTPDVSIAFQEEVRAAARNRADRKVLIACGSFNLDTVAEVAHKCHLDLRIVVQATEDAHWLEANRDKLNSLMLSAEIVDVRGAPLSEFIDAVATGDCVLSARFHAMMVGIMAELPTVAVGVHNDKRHRVKQDLGEYANLTFINSHETTDEEFVVLCCERFLGEANPDATARFSAKDLAPLRELLRAAIAPAQPAVHPLQL
ncbi:MULTISPECIES: polysaccharide pyruvyl transferase family protein [unclassified Beijerinckia]|uniref:polysaccharide pyruvyl transferase family protein n=1 Tax=unclassified Beijerinckia TaxID=2638183 RepID=UPI00089560E4|nr:MULTISPECIES: polysaccharide pyruvyl transferase family protein [unclassified Beijerinckia]MDH7797503.1 polysaccharide pyruvyl transferase WcaK-like protein [Beijerinckia sp. GAS462]SEC88189.1 Polysaccharide pyruvyl transferase family protein WcaK [Beijerinckia sp. 28-YEA-48]